MNLSPNDIRNYEFSSQMRGYDKDAVDAFLDQVADSMDMLKQENLKLSLEVDSITKQVNSLKQFEDTIKSAAIDARRNADNTVAAAKEEAEAILEKANEEATAIVGSRAEKVKALDGQLSKLEMVRNSYLNKLQELIQSHLEIVKEIDDVQSEREELPQIEDSPAPITFGRADSIEVTDSSEVDRSKLETIATRPSHTANTDDEATNESGGIMAVHTDESVHADKSRDSEESAGSDETVDSELAEAIRNYKSEADFSDTADIDKNVVETPSPEQTIASPPPAPKPGEWIETHQRAEDIPEGFISQAGSAANDPRLTGAIPIAKQGGEFENDTSKVEKTTTSVDPDEIANELDAVAAKFDEEMTKAEKN